MISRDRLRDRYDVAIVGAGHAGVNLAAALAKEGFSGSVALLSNEACLPYERPPLSKGYLAGEISDADILLRSEDYWNRTPIELCLGFEVLAVDAEAKSISTSGAGSVAYDTLVWAAGGRARALHIAGAQLEGVLTIRTLDDVNELSHATDTAVNAVIIGGGYIGLEFAAVLRHRGLNVVVLEMQNRLLARVTGKTISDFILDVHRRYGVDIRLGVAVSGIRGLNGRVESVELADGSCLPADIVLVGIGLEPNVEALVEAGAVAGNGLHVDSECRTSLPSVFAIGDCASHPNPFVRAERFRLESVQNALEQANTVAAAILGRPQPYDVVPWFWSNQFEIRLKTAGVLVGYDREQVRGDPASGRFSVGYFSDDELLAVDSVGRPAEHAAARTLIRQHQRMDPIQFSDETRNLKDFVHAENRSEALVPAGAVLE